jgi:DNA-binding transcriptional MerR regulator
VTVTRIHPSPNELEAPDGYVTAGALVARAGITYRQLDYWTRTGLLADLPRPERAGSGFPRYYLTDQVGRATTIRLLLDAGLSLIACRRVVDDLLETGEARLNEAFTLHLPTEP